MADANALKDHIDAGGRPGFAVQANPFARKHLKAALYVSRTIRVNGRLCDSREVLSELLDWIKVAATLDDVKAEWEEIGIPFAGKAFQHRFHEFKRRLEILGKALALRTHIEAAREHGRLLGLAVIPFVQVADVRRLAEVVTAVEVEEGLQEVKRDLASHIENLHRVRRLPDAHYLVSEAAAAIESRDVDRFARVASEIEDARKALLLLQRRDDLLSSLGCCAPLRDALASSASESFWGAAKWDICLWKAKAASTRSRFWRERRRLRRG